MPALFTMKFYNTTVICCICKIQVLRVKDKFYDNPMSGNLRKVAEDCFALRELLVCNKSKQFKDANFENSLAVSYLCMCDYLTCKMSVLNLLIKAYERFYFERANFFCCICYICIY